MPTLLRSLCMIYEPTWSTFTESLSHVIVADALSRLVLLLLWWDGWYVPRAATSVAGWFWSRVRSLAGCQGDRCGHGGPSRLRSANLGWLLCIVMMIRWTDGI
jgi:phosphoribosyl-AMP cyclohydrolase